jgi:ribonuclease P protein component
MTSRRRAGNGHGRPQRRRLSRSAEFERVYRHGRAKGNRFFVLYAFPRDESDREAPEPADASKPANAPDGPRLGLSVSRRVGGAVERSRVKRVLREAFWAEAERLPAGSDYVVVARPEAGPLAERDGLAGVQQALAELVDSLAGQDAPSRSRS